MGEVAEYEVSGIETIARGVCVVNGFVLLCRPKKGGYSYLPGGHIEFGEKGCEALVREVREEMGLESAAGAMLGVVESQFEQHGKRHCEITLVYDLTVSLPDGLIPHAGAAAPVVPACEDWIEFVWWPLNGLSAANLLPLEIAKYVKCGLTENLSNTPLHGGTKI